MLNLPPVVYACITDGLYCLSFVCHFFTPTGYGYNGRVSQRCDLGTYNAPDTYGTCSPCPFGTTTSAVGAGVTILDCGLAAGFGNVSGTITPCPIGTYNGAAYTPVGSSGPCTECPGFTTTTVEGASSMEQCSRKCPTAMALRIPYTRTLLWSVFGCMVVVCRMFSVASRTFLPEGCLL